MKLKFKKYSDVQSFKHNKYRQLLSAYLKKNIGKIDHFILEKDAQFKDAGTLPFLYVGDISNDWREFKNKNKQKDTFAAGRCFIEELGEGFVVKLLAEVGKGAKDKTVKEVNKILKKDDIYIEFISELPDLNAIPEQEKGEKTPLDKIEEAIETYVAAYSQYQKDPEKVEEKNKVLKRLKRLCEQWRHAHENGATPSSRHAKIEKDVQKFEAFFAKRKAAKEGTTNDPEALAIREEKLYAKTLKFRKEFYQSIANGQVRDVAVIENQLEDMKSQLGEWNKFIKQSKQASYKEALKQMIEEYKEAHKVYHKIKKDLTHFFEAIENNDVARATALVKVLESKL